MKFDTATDIAPAVLERHATPSPMFRGVMVLRNTKGLIGGYVLLPKVPDSPIPYLDCHGEPLTTFHIFGSGEEKEKAQAIVTELKRLFPVEEPLAAGG
jgi:hypothetical protein